MIVLIINLIMFREPVKNAILLKKKVLIEITAVSPVKILFLLNLNFVVFFLLLKFVDFYFKTIYFSINI